MSMLDELREELPEVAKDVRINLGNVFTQTALSVDQKWGVALACAWAARPGAPGRGDGPSGCGRDRGRAGGRGPDGHDQRLLSVPAPGGQSELWRPAGAAADDAHRPARR